MTTTSTSRGCFQSPAGWATLLITACFMAVVSSTEQKPELLGTVDARSLGLDFPSMAGNRSELDHRAGRLDSIEWQDGTPGHYFGHPDKDVYGWHPRRIEVGDLISLKTIQRGRIEMVQHPEFGSNQVLAKIGDVHESTWYRLLYDLDVTPQFLGHITHNGRVVGFLTEYVQVPREEVEEVTSLPRRTTRKEACLTALRQMHARGVVHGDAHGENCLRRRDGSAVLIDFELSMETSSQAEFNRDLWIMSHTVSD